MVNEHFPLNVAVQVYSIISSGIPNTVLREHEVDIDPSHAVPDLQSPSASSKAASRASSLAHFSEYDEVPVPLPEQIAYPAYTPIGFFSIVQEPNKNKATIKNELRIINFLFNVSP